MNNLKKESDKLLWEELQLFKTTRVQKPLIEELYRRTNKSALLEKDNLALTLSTTKWKCFNWGLYPSSSVWREYPVELPELLKDAFHEHIWTIRLYEYRARIIQLEKELMNAKLNIGKNPLAYLECMKIEKQLEDYRGGE